MNEIERLLSAHAAYQRDQQTLSWEEKIRMAEAAREAVLPLRQGVRPPREAGRELLDEPEPEPRDLTK